MKFKSLNIIGGGPNAVYALEILLKKIFLKQKKCYFYVFRRYKMSK